MSQRQATERTGHPMQRQVQAVISGNFKVLSQPGRSYATTRRQLVRQGFHLEETAHFLLARLPSSPAILLVHPFSAQQIDNSLGEYLVQELTPYGVLTGEEAFGAALIGVVTSVLPSDPVAAWGRFSLNTFQRLCAHLDGNHPAPAEPDRLLPFASIYRRLSELLVGSSLLDVGCACAFWPLLVARRYAQQMQRILGVDTRPDALALSEQLAALLENTTAKFTLADVLAPDFPSLGRFDTVTAIHLLEHLSEQQLPDALLHLLQVTRHRLLIAVPYEAQPTLAYGHAQVFTPAKLETWGNWCVQQLEGKGTMHCEALEGGLLLIERTAGEGHSSLERC